MVGFLDQQVDSKCKNLLDSYGEICVKCNCCGRLDRKTMYKCRLKVAKRWLKEDLEKITQPGFQTALQQKNIRTDIRYFKQLINYDERKIKEAKA